MNKLLQFLEDTGLGIDGGLLVIAALAVLTLVADRLMFAPKRPPSAGDDEGGVPGFVAAAQLVLAISLFALVVRFLDLDLETILVVFALLTGITWFVHARFFSSRSIEPADAKEPDEPVLVEYSRTFFPVIIIVLLIRSFAYEPFRIPSSSMMPTLLVGDFIFVNKYDFGLRLPVLRTKILDVGAPERGDVVVFRLPADPSTNYIKRVVGLPGDIVRYDGRRLTINGETVRAADTGQDLRVVERDGHGRVMTRIFDVWDEQLGDRRHRLLLTSGKPSTDPTTYVVEPGKYFLMGDNRDNSKDSRFIDVGLVPEANLVGRAVRIWLNLGQLSRVGDKIV